MKPIVWLGNSRDKVHMFSADARRDAGYQLDLVQNGKDPDDWKPLPVVGLGVREIRIHAENEYRVLYVAQFSEAVYVIHAFTKKSQETPRSDLELAGRRYRELIKQRKHK